MNLRQTIKIALRALKTNKTRSILTMLGVVIGVMSVILLVSVGSGLQKYVTDQLEGIGSNLIIIMPGKIDLSKMGEGGGGMGLNFMTSKLTEKDAKDLVTNSNYISAAIPGTAAQSALKYGDQKMFSEVNGLIYNFNEVMKSPLSEGDYFTESDDRAGKKVVVIGSGIAEKFFGDDDPIGQRIQVGENRFTVVGVLKSRGVGGNNSQDGAIIPLLTAKRIFNQDKVSVIYLQAKSADQVDLAIEDAKSILMERLKEDEFSVLTQKDMLSAITGILGTLTAALTGIAAISLIVGGIGIMNIMLVSVTERTKEIGLRKALGATPSVILNQFLVEAVILSVAGGVIGIILGAGISLVLSKFIPTEVTFWLVLLAFGVSALVGIIFGVMPARKASRLTPIEALRFE
ncbi:MAG: ABC transporter permease [Candidatus Daviesbacteria bacterium]|nr:ABC transporter permease [Candidatus Daviesbacteria bacterium]